jgi:HD-like signal output (HDOD) protein
MFGPRRSVARIAGDLARRYPLPGRFTALLAVREHSPGAAARLASTLGDTHASYRARRRLALTLGESERTADVRSPDSVPWLIHRHGFRRVHSAALVTTLLAGLRVETRHLDWLTFCRHSVCVALVAERVAESGMSHRTRGTEADLAFSAGLLHDAGLLLLDATEPELTGALVAAIERRGGGGGYPAEREALGFALDDLTTLILARWEVPHPIIEAVIDQEAAPERRTPLGAALAAAIDGSAGLGCPGVHHRAGRPLPAEVLALALDTLRTRQVSEVDRALAMLLAPPHRVPASAD